ncbi:G1/S-specific cyclin-D1-like [Oratosquilla oratoria]|uniref:G1/S-specific cyclin-D1-like n=1 Tax=Oratosquilla oratoria TaxID=337810 RepID=UPI003F76FBAD
MEAAMDMSIDLLCCENASLDLDMTAQTYLDPVLLRDDRVLSNLLRTEDFYAPNPAYFACVQSEVKECNRELVAQWMMQVCQEERCSDEVFTLAVNMMDRFLSLKNVSRTQLQLLGTVCLFLASKLKQNPPLSAEKLVDYTDDAITREELTKMELLVLSLLKWDVSAITPHAFLDQILDRLQLGMSEMNLQTVRENATYFIRVCTTDPRFTATPPSMVAAAAVASAVNGLLPNVDEVDALEAEEARGGEAAALDESATASSSSCRRYMQNLYDRLTSITHIDSDCLRECHRQIESWTQRNPDTPSTNSITPTNVREVIF